MVFNNIHEIVNFFSLPPWSTFIISLSVKYVIDLVRPHSLGDSAASQLVQGICDHTLGDSAASQ